MGSIIISLIFMIFALLCSFGTPRAKSLFSLLFISFLAFYVFCIVCPCFLFFDCSLCIPCCLSLSVLFLIVSFRLLVLIVNTFVLPVLSINDYNLFLTLLVDSFSYEKAWQFSERLVPTKRAMHLFIGLNKITNWTTSEN